MSGIDGERRRVPTVHVIPKAQDASTSVNATKDRRTYLSQLKPKINTVELQYSKINTVDIHCKGPNRKGKLPLKNPDLNLNLLFFRYFCIENNFRHFGKIPMVPRNIVDF